MATLEFCNLWTFKGNKEQLDTVIRAHSKAPIVLTIFYAQWCGPSIRLTGQIPQLASENRNIPYIKIDVNENPDLADELEIKGVPYFIVWTHDKEGNPVKSDEIKGLDTSALRAIIHKYDSSKSSSKK